MSRKLDLQLYLALNGYELKEIPEERYEDYMSEPHYSTDAEAMLELDREMHEKGYAGTISTYGGTNLACYAKRWETKELVHGETEPLARALAAYKALTGKEYQDGNN